MRRHERPLGPLVLNLIASLLVMASPLAGMAKEAESPAGSAPQGESAAEPAKTEAPTTPPPDRTATIAAERAMDARKTLCRTAMESALSGKPGGLAALVQSMPEALRLDGVLTPLGVCLSVAHRNLDFCGVLPNEHGRQDCRARVETWEKVRDLPEGEKVAEVFARQIEAECLAAKMPKAMCSGFVEAVRTKNPAKCKGGAGQQAELAVCRAWASRNVDLCPKKGEPGEECRRQVRFLSRLESATDIPAEQLPEWAGLRQGPKACAGMANALRSQCESISGPATGEATEPSASPRKGEAS